MRHRERLVFARRLQVPQAGDQAVGMIVKFLEERLAIGTSFDVTGNLRERRRGQIADGKRAQLLLTRTGKRSHGLDSSRRPNSPIMITPKRYKNAWFPAPNT